eukprot:2176093-Prymnesium_polylepis.2
MLMRGCGAWAVGLCESICLGEGRSRPGLRVLRKTAFNKVKLSPTPSPSPPPSFSSSTSFASSVATCRSRATFGSIVVGVFACVLYFCNYCASVNDIH